MSTATNGRAREHRIIFCDCCGGDGCAHEWLDRPESDTRQCLICGTEVAGR